MTLWNQLAGCLPSRKTRPVPERAATGLWGERQAEQFLRQKGFRILGRRVRLGRRDELDLVARDGDVLVFVEVKTRESEAFGRPATAVDPLKRQVISRAAVHYLKAIRCPPICFRFDVVEIVGSRTATPPLIRHIENAFGLDRRYRMP